VLICPAAAFIRGFLNSGRAANQNIAFRNGRKESDTSVMRNPNPVIIGLLLQSLIAEGLRNDEPAVRSKRGCF
jgi:hypothetical protein